MSRSTLRSSLTMKMRSKRDRMVDCRSMFSCKWEGMEEGLGVNAEWHLRSETRPCKPHPLTPELSDPAPLSPRNQQRRACLGRLEVVVAAAGRVGRR